MSDNSDLKDLARDLGELRDRVIELATITLQQRKELDRLRAVILSTHETYCNEMYTSRGLHAPECLLHEIAPEEPTGETTK